MWTLSLITPPATEPLSIADSQVKAHLRLDPDLTAQDALVDAAIVAAREDCEAFTGRQLITATWELWLERWQEEGIYRPAEYAGRSGWCPPGDLSQLLPQTTGSLYLPRAPLQAQVGSVDARTAGVLSITYLDGTGARVAWPEAKWETLAPQGPRAQKGQVTPVYGQSWPTALRQPGSIRIRYTAGYGAAEAVPAMLRQGMLLFLGEAHERREEQTVGETVAPNVSNAKRCWRPYRVEFGVS